MGILFTKAMGNVLTTLVGNVLTTVMGKVLDIYTFKNAPDNPYLFMSPRSGYTPMTTWAVNKRLKEYCKTADIPEDKAHSHVLRHSVSVHILLNGSGDIHYVSDHLGHTDLKSTAHYARLAPKEWEQRQGTVGSQLRKI